MSFNVRRSSGVNLKILVSKSSKRSTSSLEILMKNIQSDPFDSLVWGLTFCAEQRGTAQRDRPIIGLYLYTQMVIGRLVQDSTIHISSPRQEHSILGVYVQCTIHQDGRGKVIHWWAQRRLACISGCEFGEASELAFHAEEMKR